MSAAKHLDPVIGIDIHIIQPPGPVPPVPIPHPFVGMVMDPADYLPVIGSTIMVNGMYGALAGTAGNDVPHIPIGGTFIKPIGNECEMFMGSSTVSADGQPLSYMALPALSCSCIGSPPPPRPGAKGGSSSAFPPNLGGFTHSWRCSDHGGWTAYRFPDGDWHEAGDGCFGKRAEKTEKGEREKG
jgi:hypothetical protein